MSGYMLFEANSDSTISFQNPIQIWKPNFV